MNQSFAAYVPFPPYVPPTKTSTTATQLQVVPGRPPQTQGLAEGGIIILICLAGILYRVLTDRF